MPLLGRHHRSATVTGAGASSVPATATAAATTTTGSGNSNKSALCESPLFGLRRQLVLSGGSGGGRADSEKRGAAGVGGKSTTAGAGGKSASSSGAPSELSSIPQQITRQQIHYAFAIMDANKDGMIDPRELGQMLANLGVPIDEAILSHVVKSSVSKRGNQRISEAEFLDWISHFIQINDSPTPSSRSNQTTAAAEQTAPGSRRRPRTPSKGRLAGRSSTVTPASSSSSLVAQPANEAAAPRTRRGSGSGLALMRSLSSGSSSSAAAAAAAAAAASSAGAPSAAAAPAGTSLARRRANDEAAAAALAADLEARDDLKAAFCVFDLDGDGFITLDEVRAGLKLLGESWSPNEIRHLFSRFNRSSDLNKQRISIDDFVEMLL